MISRYTYEKMTWIDLDTPRRDEVTALAEEYDLHPVIAGELLFPSERTKADLYDSSIYVILHFPVYDKETKTIRDVEVDFVLLKNTIITSHYELVQPLHDFAKLFEIGEYLHTAVAKPHPGHLLFFALSELYKHSLFVLETLHRETDILEKNIATSKTVVLDIAEAMKKLRTIQEALRYHRETLTSLTHACQKIYGTDFSYYTNTLLGYFNSMEQLALENRSLMSDLQRTSDSLILQKTAESNKKLGTLTIIFGVLIILTITLATYFIIQ